MSPTDDDPAERRKRLLIRPLLILPGLLLLACFCLDSPVPGKAASVSPTPEPDPLAIPIVPENPGAIDLGRITYYYHCMPCHGDKGQGLTDEWREVWEEDHQNCWSRGCHGGKAGDLAFAIPRYVPPVMPPFSSLARFGSLDDLADFLQASHPPQNPGVLDETDCQTLAAYLTHSLPRGSVFEVAAAAAEARTGPTAMASVVKAALALAATLAIAWLTGWRERD